MTLTNVTLSGNTAGTAGAAVYVVGGSTLSAVNTTIANNSTPGNGGGIAVVVGGVAQLKNTIVASNTATGSGPDIDGAVTSQGYNLFGSTTGATIGGDTTGNLTSAAPLLGALANNGGLTHTLALLAGSPAINAGTCTGAPATDQRGMARPQNAMCDIGAYERGAPATLTATAGTPQTAPISSAFATALAARVVDSLGVPLDGEGITFAGPASGAGVSAGGTVSADATGSAAFTATANATVGSYVVSATAGSLSASFNLTNSQASPGIALARSAGASPSTYGDSVTFTATLSGGANPTGSVNFRDAGNSISGCAAQTLSAGVASCTVATLSAGLHAAITAVYGGDGHNAGVTSSALSHTVSNAAPVTTVSGNIGTGQITANLMGGGTCGFASHHFTASLPATAPVGTTFPHGVFRFTLSNCSGPVTVRVTYPTALPANSSYSKYGPVTLGGAAKWYLMPGAAVSDTTATFTLTDGSLGDDDMTANGTIIDDGGPSWAPTAAGAASIPTLSEWGVMLLSVLMLAFGVRQVKRSRPCGCGIRYR